MKDVLEIGMLSGIFSLGMSGAFAAAFYYHVDHLGSTSVVTDQDARVVELLSYTPFGEILIPPNPPLKKGGMGGFSPYLFTGQELDRSSELYYYGARYYDSTLTVLLSQDPLLQGSLPEIYLLQPARLNGYKYGLGNPLRFVDIEGRIDADQLPVMVQSLDLLFEVVEGRKERIATLPFRIHGANIRSENFPLSEEKYTVLYSAPIQSPSGAYFESPRGSQWSVAEAFSVQIASPQRNKVYEIDGVGVAGKEGRVTFGKGIDLSDGLALLGPDGKLNGIVLYDDPRLPGGPNLEISTKIFGVSVAGATPGVSIIGRRFQGEEKEYMTATRTGVSGVPFIHEEEAFSRTSFEDNYLNSRGNGKDIKRDLQTLFGDRLNVNQTLKNNVPVR